MEGGGGGGGGVLESSKYRASPCPKRVGDDVTAKVDILRACLGKRVGSEQERLKHLGEERKGGNKKISTMK